MAKILSSSEYNSLKAKADGYDQIVTAMRENNENLKEEEITTDIIIEAVNASSPDSTDPELQSKFDTLQSNYDSLLQERNELKEQNENLLNTPPEDPAPITSSSEVDAQPQTIAEFANKNKGNTAAILEMCKKDGLI